MAQGSLLRTEQHLGDTAPTMAHVLLKDNAKAIILVMLFIPAHSSAIKWKQHSSKAQLKLISTWKKKWLIIILQGVWNYQATWLLVKQCLWETWTPYPKSIQIENSDMSSLENLPLFPQHSWKRNNISWPKTNYREALTFGNDSQLPKP